VVLDKARRPIDIITRIDLIDFMSRAAAGARPQPAGRGGVSPELGG